MPDLDMIITNLLRHILWSAFVIISSCKRVFTSQYLGSSLRKLFQPGLKPGCVAGYLVFWSFGEHST